MINRSFLTLLSIFVAVSTFAQRVEKVTAQYTYLPPENVTLEIARETALNRAKIQAIADEFGTIVSQQNSTIIKNQNGESSIDMLSLGGSEVKGEWIETIGEPIYNISYDQGMLVVSVEVKGRIREIVSAPVDFTAKILCNGTEDRFERTDFRNGDDLYLSFTSPINGFLAVYLVDDNKDAFCLLPYQNQTSGIYSIEANKHYVFFSERHAPTPSEANIIDEYTLTTDKDLERNQIYVIFSPNSFTKAADSSANNTLPRQLNWEQFQKWLATVRTMDKEMRVEKTLITIK